MNIGYITFNKTTQYYEGGWANFITGSTGGVQSESYSTVAEYIKEKAPHAHIFGNQPIYRKLFTKLQKTMYR